MSLSRRRLLATLAAASAAPAIVKAENLMKIWVPPESRFILKSRSIGWTEFYVGGIQTRSGSFYRLGDPDPDYEKAFPGARDRLLEALGA